MDISLKTFTNRCSIRRKYLDVYKYVFSELVFISAHKGVDISFKPIDDAVMSDLNAQWKNVKFDWESLFLRYRRFCKRIDFAIYYEDQLVAMLFGKVSIGRRVIRIDYIEATSKSSRPPALEAVAALALATIESIGKQLESEYIALRNPTNKKVSDHYKKYQYSFDVEFDGVRANTMYKKIL